MELRNTKDNPSIFRGVDWVVISIYLIFVVWGAVSIYAASYNFDSASIFNFSENSGKQFVWIGLSLVIACSIMITDYRIYESYAYPIYAAIIVLLVVTIFLAKDVKGSHSWLQFGSISIQPAEFGKFATALALAKLFDSYQFRLNARISNYLRAMIIIMLPVILVIAQSEMGSALVYLSLAFVLYREGMSGLVLMSAALAVIYFVVAVKFSTLMVLGIPSGQFSVMMMIMAVYIMMVFFYCRNFGLGRTLLIGYAATILLIVSLVLLGVQEYGWVIIASMYGLAILYTVVVMFRHKLQKYLITLTIALASLGFLFSVNLVFNVVLQEHQKGRVEVLLGIKDDPKGDGYNVNQSKIAIGSGGITGKGFLNGTQTKLRYVPEQHTDFIFCTIGEEEGFVGSAIVLGLFTVFILRLIKIAERQRSNFGRVYGYCVVSYFIFHICINIGMVIGLCPVIGIPLPFFSYGGSSLWGFTILLFILLRIDASRKERKE